MRLSSLSACLYQLRLNNALVEIKSIADWLRITSAQSLLDRSEKDVGCQCCPENKAKPSFLRRIVGNDRRFNIL